MEISLLLSFFLWRHKERLKERGGGGGGGGVQLSLRVLMGFSASKQKQNGSVNKKAVSNARLERKAASVVGLETATAFFGELWSFVGPCVGLTNFPSRNVLPQ